MDSLAVGGAEHQVAVLARGLRARGVAVRILVLFAGGPGEAPLRRDGIPVDNLGFARLGDRGWRALVTGGIASVRLTLRLWRLRPHVVHTHLLHADVVGVPAARLARVAAIVSTRHSEATYAAQGLVAYAAQGLVERLLGLAVAAFPPQVTAAVSHAVAADIRRRARGVAAQVVVIWNGLPETAFIPTPAVPLDSALPVVLCIAQMRPAKGHRYLLAAMAELRRRGLECTTVLLGEGREMAALRAQRDRLGIDVRFPGCCTDVGAWLARADIAVLPSLHEGLPIAVMEAMARGVPVVASAVGGIPELLRGRGVLVPPADPIALADALHRLLNDHDLASTLRSRAFTWARDRLPADLMIDHYLRLYLSQLQPDSRTR